MPTNFIQTQLKSSLLLRKKIWTVFRKISSLLMKTYFKQVLNYHMQNIGIIQLVEDEPVAVTPYRLSKDKKEPSLISYLLMVSLKSVKSSGGVNHTHCKLL